MRTQQETQSAAGTFHGFVLLDDHEFHMDALISQIKQDWGITTQEEAKEDILVFQEGACKVAVSFIDAPIPNEEAEYNAANNYFWKAGKEVVETHVAQLLIAVMGHDSDPREAGKLYVKITDSACKLPHVIGIYTSGTVFQPELYHEFAQELQDGEYPINNLIYFGIYYGENGLNAYTYGLTLFGKPEIEVLNTSVDAMELREFLYGISYYVIEGDITLNDGESIGFSEDQKLPITYSKAVALDGDSLKITLP